eukprot:733430-Hanusia_phi.AAC.1
MMMMMMMMMMMRGGGGRGDLLVGSNSSQGVQSDFARGRAAICRFDVALRSLSDEVRRGWGSEGEVGGAGGRGEGRGGDG